MVPIIQPPPIQQLRHTISEIIEVQINQNISVTNVESSQQILQNQDLTFGATRSGLCWREGTNQMQYDPG